MGIINGTVKHISDKNPNLWIIEQTLSKSTVIETVWVSVHMHGGHNTNACT